MLVSDINFATEDVLDLFHKEKSLYKHLKLTKKFLGNLFDKDMYLRLVRSRQV